VVEWQESIPVFLPNPDGSGDSGHAVGDYLGWVVVEVNARAAMMPAAWMKGNWVISDAGGQFRARLFHTGYPRVVEDVLFPTLHAAIMYAELRGVRHD
jgi:hypothetical protein